MYGKCARAELGYQGMAGWVSPLVRGCCVALLALCGCRGTEHSLFRETVPPMVDNHPAPVRDASVPPMEEAGAAGGLTDPLPPPEDAGGPELDPGLDPKITFPWTETLPGKGTCRAGLY